MQKEQLTSRIVLYQFLGFAFVIAWIWLDEVVDFPALLFGAPPVTPRWEEVIEESTVFLILGALMILMTRNLLRRIKYLEGFLPVCSFCRRIRVGEDWVTLERYVADHSEARFSHSFCPSCTTKHYSEFDKDSS